MSKGCEKAQRMALRRANGSREVRKTPAMEPPRGPAYLIAHACFACRKSWKMASNVSDHVCPECGQTAVFMGRSFKAPRKSDEEQWKKVERLWEEGFRFQSYRTHPAAEPLPDRLSEVDDFIARNPDHPFRVTRR